MNKYRNGFSYIEILITLTLFSIMLIVILPTLLQGGRNLNFAESHYTGHLAAQEIMLITRDAILDGNDPELALSAMPRDVEYYKVWIFGQNEISIGTKIAENLSTEISHDTNLVGHRYIIIAMVWNNYGNIIGRAVGTVPS